MKYVSLDLETTGLDPNKHAITEFALVVDDLSRPQSVDFLPAITGYVDHAQDLVWSIGAANMFRDRFAEYEIAQKVYVKDVVDRILGFLPAFVIDDFAKRCTESGFNAQLELRKNKITFAGKNFAGFDKEFLRRLPKADQLMDVIHHSSIDPGTLYFDPKKDTELPDTKECKRRANIPGKVSHKALDDALDVVKMIRAKYNIAF